MKVPLRFVCFVLLATFFITGCGESPGPEGSDDGERSFASPEALAKHVHACVLANDFEAFRKACVTVDDIAVVLDLAVSSKETDNLQKRIDQINADPAAHEAKLREYFDKVVAAVHSAGKYDVELIAAEEPRKLYPDTKTKRLWKIYICLTSGSFIGVDAPVLVNGQWLIYDDDPLIYFETKPHHREHKIADGFSADGLKIAKP